MNFSFADYLVIILYFAAVFYAGFYLSERRKERSAGDAADFLLGGRKLTLPLFVATLVATWYGSILGVGEFVYSQGVLAWASWGLPYYLTAGIFAFFIAGKIRSAGVNTIPEHIEKKFGRKAGFFSSFLVLVITIPASYTLMLGNIIQILTGWPLWTCISAGALLSLVYIYTGGFRADVFANTVQFAFMYIGFAVLLFFAIRTFGSPGDMIGRLPETHRTITGAHSWQYLAAWFFVALQTFIDPSFHQRCSAAVNPATAKRGILLSVFFWMIFDFFTLSCGLYAKSFLPGIQPLMAYPGLAEAVLPAFWKGIFLVAMLATVMSTLDSYAFISAATIGNDILAPFWKRIFRREASIRQLTRFGLLLSSGLSVYFAINIPSAIDLIYRAASIAVPGLLLPVLVAYSRGFSLARRAVIPVMIASAGISLFWVIGASAEWKLPGFSFSAVEPMMPGIAVSVILTLFFLRRTNNANHTGQ